MGVRCDSSRVRQEQVQHQNAGVRITESRNRLAPIFAVAIRTALLESDALAVLDESRTARAGDDFGVQNLEPVGCGHSSALYLLVCRTLPVTLVENKSLSRV